MEEKEIVEQSKLTNEEVDEKIAQIKESIAKNKSKSIRVLYGYADIKLAEYRNKKEKNRRRNKLAKINRKKNR